MCLGLLQPWFLELSSRILSCWALWGLLGMHFMQLSESRNNKNGDISFLISGLSNIPSKTTSLMSPYSAGLESRPAGFSFQAHSFKPLPLAVVLLDARCGKWDSIHSLVIGCSVWLPHLTSCAATGTKNISSKGNPASLHGLPWLCPGWPVHKK